MLRGGETFQDPACPYGIRNCRKPVDDSTDNVSAIMASMMRQASDAKAGSRSPMLASARTK
jgi:hypothetical protein